MVSALAVTQSYISCNFFPHTRSNFILIYVLLVAMHLLLIVNHTDVINSENQYLMQFCMRLIALEMYLIKLSKRREGQHPVSVDRGCGKSKSKPVVYSRRTFPTRQQTRRRLVTSTAESFPDGPPLAFG